MVQTIRTRPLDGEMSGKNPHRHGDGRRKTTSEQTRKDGEYITQATHETITEADWWSLRAACRNEADVKMFLSMVTEYEGCNIRKCGKQ